jgi:hypothetical protein
VSQNLRQSVAKNLHEYAKSYWVEMLRSSEIKILFLQFQVMINVRRNNAPVRELMAQHLQ